MSQNWIWIAVGAGVLFMFAHHMRFHGMSGSMGPGGGSGSSDQGEANLAAPVDLVSHQGLPADATISSMYRGQAYYVENRENRDAFEREPDKYVAGSMALGQLTGAKPSANNRNHRRGGCC